MKPTSKNLILGCALGYDRVHIEPFLKSLRQSECWASTYLLVDQPTDEVRTLAASYACELVSYPVPLVIKLLLGSSRSLRLSRWPYLAKRYHNTFERLPFAEDTRRKLRCYVGTAFHHISATRYFAYWDILRKNLNKFDRVLMTDVRDVHFQGDLFTEKNQGPLNCTLEEGPVSIGSCPWNRVWLEEMFTSDPRLPKLLASPISCSGTTWGDAKAVFSYLSKMIDTLTATTGGITLRHGYDQGAHNYLLWTQSLGTVQIQRNQDGPVLTMGKMSREQIHPLINQNHNQLTDSHGRPYAMIHQHDRHEWLRCENGKFFEKISSDDSTSIT